MYSDSLASLFGAERSREVKLNFLDQSHFAFKSFDRSERASYDGGRGRETGALLNTRSGGGVYRGTKEEERSERVASERGTTGEFCEVRARC